MIAVNWQRGRATRRLISLNSLALLVLVLGLTAPAARAQVSSGTILGTVTDQSSAVIVGAQVTATQTATGVRHTTVTDELGNFRILSLLPGTYKVEVAKEGFKQFIGEGILLEVNKQYRLNVQLHPGTVSENITIAGTSPALETETGQLGGVVENRLILSLPLITRNVQTLKLLVPGVVDRRNFEDDFGVISSGGLIRKDPYIIDGAYSSFSVWSGSFVNPNPDTIQEFKVLTNSFSAEFGMTSGAIVTAATKAGTNNIHGSAFEFFRNEALDARNPFVTRPLAGISNPDCPPSLTDRKDCRFKGPLRYNQFGGTIGGPIIKEKTFFFFDAQWTRRRGRAVFTNLSVPPQAFRAGDFSAILGPQVGIDPLGRPILRNQIYDPATTRTVTVGGQSVTVRDPFPDNKIPTARFNPAALKVLQLYPNPQTSGLTANFNAAGSTIFNQYLYDIRVDHNFSARDRLMARYSRQQNYSENPRPFGEAGGDSSGISRSPSRQLTFNETHIFGPRMTNDFHFTWNRIFPLREPTGFGKVSLADFGITGMPNGAEKLGIPWFDIQNYSRLGSNQDTLFFELQQTFAFMDVANLMIGRHALKFGGEMRQYAIENFQPIPFNGRFIFNNLHTDLPGFTASTGNGFASFLLGQVTNFNYEIFPGYFKPRSSVYSLFLQDDIKVNRRLTVNAGLRWDGVPYWKEQENRSGIFVLEQGQFVQFGTDGFRETPWKNDWLNFGPRFGFAYDLGGDQKTVIRGGYGLFYVGVQGNGRNGFLPLGPIFADQAAGRYTSFDQINAAFTLDKVPYVPNDKTGRTLKGVGVFTDENPMSYYQQWNLNIQREIKSIVVEIGYAGSKGTHLPYGGYNLNALTPAQAAQAQGNFTPFLKFPQYPGGVSLSGFFGASSYNSLQLKAEKRFSQGLAFVTAYTWQKTIAVGDVGYRDISNFRLDRGIEQNSVPQRLSIAYSYQLPLGPGRRWLQRGPASYVLGGWELSGITSLQSGFPLTPSISFDSCRCFTGQARPNVVGNPRLSRSERSLNRFFNTEAFTNPALYTVGNAGRGLLYGPGLVNFDTSLVKRFRVQENGDLEFRWEMFNATNTPAFNNPDTRLGSPTFGRILGTVGNPRQMQFALKYNF